MSALPDPIDVPWSLRPLDSAVTTLEHLDDGRLRLAIVHGLLEGVTPEMLVFWFRHIEGTMLVSGRSHARYHVRHPRDHVAHRLARRAPDGIGAAMATITRLLDVVVRRRRPRA